MVDLRAGQWQRLGQRFEKTCRFIEMTAHFMCSQNMLVGSEQQSTHSLKKLTPLSLYDSIRCLNYPLQILVQLYQTRSTHLPLHISPRARPLHRHYIMLAEMGSNCAKLLGFLADHCRLAPGHVEEKGVCISWDNARESTPYA